MDAFVVIVHGHRQHFLGQVLADHMPIQIFHDLLRRRWLAAIIVRRPFGRHFLSIHLAEHDKEMIALDTFDEARRRHKRADMCAGIAAFRTGHCFVGWLFVVAIAAGGGARWRWPRWWRRRRRRIFCYALAHMCHVVGTMLWTGRLTVTDLIVGSGTAEQSCK